LNATFDEFSVKHAQILKYEGNLTKIANFQNSCHTGNVQTGSANIKTLTIYPYKYVAKAPVSELGVSGAFVILPNPKRLSVSGWDGVARLGETLGWVML
jgi:hypothetical protein